MAVDTMSPYSTVSEEDLMRIIAKKLAVPLLGLTAAGMEEPFTDTSSRQARSAPWTSFIQVWVGRRLWPS